MYFGTHSGLLITLSTVYISYQTHCTDTLYSEDGCGLCSRNTGQYPPEYTAHYRVVMCEGVLESGGTDSQITSAVRDGLWPTLPPEVLVPVG